jgi:predicted RNA-binding Zn-ribbon protein involved in translation (DUF1610 family)
MFHSVVCFVGDTCQLKTELPGNVILGGPFGYIRAKTQVLLTDERVMEIVQTIKIGMRPKNFIGLSTAETKREHLDSLKNRHASTKTCPKCGGNLVLRTAKSGMNVGRQFYGCGKFPTCRHMSPFDGLTSQL